MRYCLLISVLLLFVPVHRLGADVTEAEVVFVRRVLPLLQKRCLSCHGADQATVAGGLDLTTPASLSQGGDSAEPLVDRQQLQQSPILEAVQRQSDAWSPMPPKEADRLTDQEIAYLERWVTLGASWPSKARLASIASRYQDEWSAEDGVSVSTSGGLDEAWTNRRYQPEDLWAYQPVVKPQIPKNVNPVDWLLSQSLPQGLSVADRADRRTLIRRASFDLTGLPPSPEQVRQFLDDPQTDKVAFASLVDRLLASPHYGERMAQHWLDVTRYADSSGLANDYERGNAWRYRDYVVRAFHDDKPFDQFVREQIAGDELASGDPEAIIATGFLRMGPWELTGMEVAKVARQRFLDDVTNSVGEVFLAQALQCARCHDHKFDPVPTRDYYAIQAVFATTQLAERAADFLPTENTSGFEERRYLEMRQVEYRTRLAELDEVMLSNATRWHRTHNLSDDRWQAAVAEARSTRKTGIFNAARVVMRQRRVPESDYPPKLVGFTPQQFGLERVARKGLQRLTWEFERYQPFALSVYNGRTRSQKSIQSPSRIPPRPLQDGELEQTCILRGGDPFRPTTPVSPGALSVLPALEPLAIAADQLAGRRTALANWIADPSNCLTTRAIVNRIWMWHFGRGIAGNPNNFGATGKKPTHPQLLDWLADRLVEQDWSIQAIHRTIMNTDAYCRSSVHPERGQLEQLDPERRSYAVFTMRRLSAEEMRDARLCVSGELNRQQGGIPCRPEINQEVALQPRQIMGSFAAAWVPHPLPSQRHRRSLYTLKLRGLPDPMMDVFNVPPRDFSCERRDTSTVTPQVFSLLHSHAIHARALAFANRVLQDASSETEAISRVFQLAYAREPSLDETKRCLQAWQTAKTEVQASPAPPQRTVPREVRRVAVEENTGEQFSFSERLYGYDDFVPDLQPGQVDAQTRALADVCLAVLNSNEFVFVE